MNYLKKRNKKNENNKVINKYKENIIKELKNIYKPYESKDMRIIIEQFPNIILNIEYTNKNVDYSWNAYIAILHLYVKKEFVMIFQRNSEKIMEIAEKVFDDINTANELIFKNDMFFRLRGIKIAEIIEDTEQMLKVPKKVKNDTLKLAMNDANKFILDKNYTSALDRIHTFFMGYIREDLKCKNIEYTETETLNQLFKKLYSYYENKESLDKKIGTILKSMTGAISSINDLRNKNSLSHPNEYIVNQRDAKLAIDAVSLIINYLEKITC